MVNVTKLCHNIYNRICNKAYTSIFERCDRKVSRHIIVIESDDWGSIRISSRSAYEALLKAGYAMNARPYERYDCLEGEVDIVALSEVLLKYKDIKGNHPVVTLNYLCANPDFAQIAKDEYKKYSFKTIEETYQSHTGSKHVLRLVKDGINKGIFMPQCHGREHFNVQEWLNALRNGDKDVMTAFGYEMCGIFPKDTPTKGNQYMVALRSYDNESQKYVCDSVVEALAMFRKTWGFNSRSFIAPCYTWNDKIENTLYNNGVELMQGGRIRRASNNSSKKYVYVGQKSNGLIYSVRNCAFEPATTADYSTDKLMNEIEYAFKKNHIAVISSHRINYVGGIDVNNRIRNLRLLDNFLSTLLKKYPDVEFMSSNQLIDVLK